SPASRFTVSGEAAMRGSFASSSRGMKTVCPTAYFLYQRVLKMDLLQPLITSAVQGAFDHFGGLQCSTNT
ncbi:hypothetical protein, partial [Mesorhizobium robiniae]|uniref:hypothetical protein n=1 Tax=Mesorhizobium robiniae TaxID=559315 RepID=UPI003394A933